MSTLFLLLFLLSSISYAMQATDVIVLNQSEGLIISPFANTLTKPASYDSDGNILGFEVAHLSSLAPIAITMYCFNQAPQMTMVTLASLLLYVLTLQARSHQSQQQIKMLYFLLYFSSTGRYNLFCKIYETWLPAQKKIYS